ncbi:MAG: UTP--glucose-1-phosphate uridylyltransferase [Candidatus Sedimenticola endophacoides]|uniref:UTP--glucose-1-phosphate uridylyltransferase n=1 Tax=Candidatus Sedimenticola endophacoides TaxID=2548426 RepID=A0A657PPQ4_9GAMM|nr:MAG: UTP--glucose-1-phosphate uridylyltransferase [Candidatus Sedimenticola endophacoides]OQX35423.1 MAG: UTP--glucose-1-phosphate uridylyltransferase [Candidatus Sedimenticola endophacoides]OQX35978.1 MAG: UTP--glucose-1-phosphate uridylyltransferase [Candidatus Sedimenticola endophacoides]OQX40794.1 MAG: UTP--glucose-1-phosphate uridylyltransferase [Candidatus Sedimenticola endophacoides]OQX42929.1 MAG: UTP--glucose-1-phosphate uridylyltransferase [Candidatus Sedimenticola endophacoides]
MTKTVKKAVFPVAGLGTRFLPATKASPKEMLPVVDKPLIQYAVEEAVAAGIEVMVFVTGRNKTAISNHFDTAYELEHELEIRGKERLLNVVRGIVPAHVSCVFLRQSMPLGLGHAVLCAQPVIGNEPFAVVLADDLIDDGERGCLKQMVEVFSSTGATILGTQIVDPHETGSYGIVDTEDEGDLVEVKGIVEKPAPELAPSNHGVVGRYILTSAIFQHLAQTGKGAGGEIQLTDGIASLMQEESVMAYAFKGRRYDCGSKLGYLQATVDYALKHEHLGDEFTNWLRERFIR